MAIDVDKLPDRYKRQIARKLAKEEREKGQKQIQPPPPEAKKSKYGNVKTEVDGIRFDSKAEAKRYEELKILVRAGEIQGFIRQVSIPLHVDRYIADFLICNLDGTFYFEDVKGYETQTFKKKKKEIEKLYPWLDFRIIYV